MTCVRLALLLLSTLPACYGAALGTTSGKITTGGTISITFTATNALTAGQTIVFTSTRPLFAQDASAAQNLVTTITDGSGRRSANPLEFSITSSNGVQTGVLVGPDDGRRAEVAGTSTGASNKGGTVFTIITQNGAAAGPITVVLPTAALNAAAPAGIYSLTVDTDGTDTVSDAFDVPLYAAADTIAVGQPTFASNIKSAAAAAVTFNLAVQETQALNTYITITASQAIFQPSLDANADKVTSIKEGASTATLAAATATSTTSTGETDATGKILKIKILGAALTADRLVAIVVPATVMAANPSTVGVVTLSVESTDSTVASTQQYPIFNAAATALLTDVTVTTSIQAATPSKLAFTIIPYTTLAAAGKYTLTASAATFTARRAVAACAIAPPSMTAVADDCTAATTSTTALEVTLVTNGAVAGHPYTIEITDQITANSATVGAGPTWSLEASADDTTASTANAGYTLFNAALTPYFKSASVTTLTGLAAPGNMTLQFVPQTTVVGANTAGTVIFTANAAVFESGSYPGSACQGSDCIVCTSKKDLFATTVPCTASADTTGKILTVTATTVSTTTDSNDFTASEIGQVVLKNHQVNPNATAVTFTLSTGVDTTATTAQTGYTTTGAPPPPTPVPTAPSNNNETASGGYSTATTAITFAGYPYVQSTAATNFANLVGCAYANHLSDSTTHISADLCSTAMGFENGGFVPRFNYDYRASSLNTITASRRTGSTVSTALKLYHSLITQARFMTAVSSAADADSDKTAILNEMKALQVAAGLSFTDTQMTPSNIAQATWTHSSATVVVPSMMAMFSALLLVLMQ